MGKGQRQKASANTNTPPLVISDGVFERVPATAYSPASSRPEYHRRYQA
jgi:hypothetical protein